MKQDYMIRALACDEQIRAFAVNSLNSVQYMKNIHHLTPLATAALGRLLSASFMMGDMLKSDADLLTLQIHGDGPLKHLLVTSDKNGHSKGYVSNPNATLPLRRDGHLDVASGIGSGTLTVIRDYHMKQPYSSTIPLHSGEIADDLTYYFAQSEQVPSTVSLGVLLSSNSIVTCSGGFIIQLLPFTKDEVIERLESNINSLPSMTNMLSNNMSIEDILKRALDGFDITFTDKKDVSFYCGCNERKDKVIASLGKEEIEKMIDEGREVEATCAFCEKTYKFSVEDLKKIKDEL